MNLLFIGDVVGQSGCDFLESRMYKLKREYDIDVTVVNGENSAQGNGITPQSYRQLLNMGADVVTTGNHSFRRREAEELYDTNEQLLRPANYPEGVMGHGVTYIDMCPYKIAVINLMGTMYMEAVENPFNYVDKLLESIDTPNIIVDFHAEATAEKIAMGYYLDGKITAMFGTHTHVQTADEQILENGTGYITDIGMTGPMKSVIGMDYKASIKRFETTLPEKYKLADEKCMLNGCIFKINDETCRVNEVIRISRK